jgi:hypothetical protein
MAQDIRELLKEKPSGKPMLPKGHEARFEARLQAAFGVEEVMETTKRPFIYFMKIAAIAIAFIAVSVFGYYSITNTNGDNLLVEEATPISQPEDTEKQIRLADLSPDFKRVEDFYMASINVQLASLEITDDTKDVIDGYMQQLKVLTEEYESLNAEFIEVGPTEETITALIDNLKLRLELLMKLKTKLKELKNQTNENISSLEA